MKQQVFAKSQSELRKQQFEEELKQIIDQIKQTYFQFLSSLKFQNINDKQSYKKAMRTYKNTAKNRSIQDVDESKNQIRGFDIDQESIGSVSNKLSIKQLQIKEFSFEEELSVQNKGYLAFIRLIRNIKQLQDYNHFLRSVIMNSDRQKHLLTFQNELLEDLKKLQIQVPNIYYLSKKS